MEEVGIDISDHQSTAVEEVVEKDPEATLYRNVNFVNIVQSMNVTAPGQQMDIVITREALNSYLDLLHRGYISKRIYETTLRPDILLLDDYPDPPEFDRGKFWSPAKGRRGRIRHGYKMKWHNVGPGRVQLRLPVALDANAAYLSKAYVKESRKKELRELARFDVHVTRIRRGNHTEEGRL